MATKKKTKATAKKPKAAAKKPVKKATPKKPAKKTAAKKPAKKAAAKKPTKPAAKAAKKPAVKAAAKPKTQARTKQKAPRPRRDATGHLDPAYAADLRRMSRENETQDDDRAFLVGERADDALANELGAEFVETVTSGEDEGIELRDQDVPEEVGGPFVTTNDGAELALDTDESNPPDATREPFPKT